MSAVCSARRIESTPDSPAKPVARTTAEDVVCFLLMRHEASVEVSREIRRTKESRRVAENVRFPVAGT